MIILVQLRRWETHRHLILINRATMPQETFDRNLLQTAIKVGTKTWPEMDLMNINVVVYARFDTLPISQPFYTKQQREAPLLSLRKMS